MKFWLLISAMTVGGVWYHYETRNSGSSEAISLDEITPNCSNIRAFENSRLSAGEVYGVPARNEEELIYCFPSYDNKPSVVKDHLRYGEYYRLRVMQTYEPNQPQEQ